MPTAIRIAAGSVELKAELNDSETAKAIAQALPIEAQVSTWGDEIYFAIPVSCGAENPQEVVEPGDLAYWPPGSAFCIFFGHTPASEGDEIRPASAVNMIGRVEGDATALESVPDGARIAIEAA